MPTETETTKISANVERNEDGSTSRVAVGALGSFTHRMEKMFREEYYSPTEPSALSNLIYDLGEGASLSKDEFIEKTRQCLGTGGFKVEEYSAEGDVHNVQWLSIIAEGSWPVDKGKNNGHDTIEHWDAFVLSPAIQTYLVRLACADAVQRRLGLDGVVRRMVNSGDESAARDTAGEPRTKNKGKGVDIIVPKEYYRSNRGETSEANLLRLLDLSTGSSSGSGSEQETCC